jgi:hypothetical protein
MQKTLSILLSCYLALAAMILLIGFMTGLSLKTLLSLIFACFFILAGLVLILGSMKRWKWLVDPPVKDWPFDSRAFLKKWLGPEGLLVFNYIMGALFIILSLLGILNIVTK